MSDEETLEKISELTAEIGELPKGYISKKTINGTVYYYHQWSENGAKQSRYLHDDEIEALSAQIAKRKELQTKLREIKSDKKNDTFPQKEIQNGVNRMKCTLMHKRIAVADIELDDATGFIQKIGTVYEPEHLPVGVRVKGGIADRTALNSWWIDRFPFRQAGPESEKRLKR